MRSTLRLVAAAALAASLAAPGLAADYAVDPDHTTVGFSVRHILTRVAGRFRESSGMFSFDERAPQAAQGRFTVKAASIDTNAERRDAHLRSQDFFWAEKYPELTLVVRKLTPAEEKATYKADADLTIRGVTKPVVLDVEYAGTVRTPWGATVATFGVRGKINRKGFGLLWNKTLEGGGVLVGDEVELLLDVEAVVQSPAKS